MIPYSRQSISKTDIQNVVKVLKSKIISRGKNIENFETELKKKFKSKHCLVVNNGTNALYLACKSLGLKKNDIVWTVPITFAATVNAALMCDAKIDFVDIDLKTFNINIEQLKKKLLSTPKSKIPKLLMIVHLGGNPVEMKKIFSLSKKYKFKIIEDASHAMGSSYMGQKIGSCKWSDICIFSFHAVKSITTSEGGAILTNKSLYCNKIRLMRENGLTSSLKSSGMINYNLIEPGLNFRISEVLAALGLSQITKLNRFVLKRNLIAKFYKSKIHNYPLKIQLVQKNSKSSYHLFIILLNEKFNMNDRDKIISILKKKKYYLNSHYKALHLSDYFKKLGYKRGDFPKAEYYSDNSISIPIYPQLTISQINLFLKNLKKLLDEKK